MEKLHDDSMEEDEEVNEAGTKRAEVRKGYKNLMEAIATNGEILAVQSNEDNNVVLKYLQIGEQLFSQVKAPQECVMDANVVRNLSRICKQQASQMSANINTFKYEEYVERLKMKLNFSRGPDKKKWLMLGEQAKAMFRRSPSLDFMFGALSAIPPQPKDEKSKERKARQATKVSDLKETQALILQETETSDNLTDRIVQKIYKQLVMEWKNNGKKPINFFKFVLHPDNFGTSIENMFHVSFLIKENKAGISICPDIELPVIEPISSKQNKEEGVKYQVVMNINMNDWKKLVKNLKIETPMIS